MIIREVKNKMANKWLEHVSKVRKENTKMKQKDILKKAKGSYKKDE